MSKEEIANALVRQYGWTPERAAQEAQRQMAIRLASGSPRVKHMRALSDPPVMLAPAPFEGVVSAEQTDLGISQAVRARRSGDALWMEIASAPRTKKNSAETLGSQKSPQYKRYLAELLEAIAQVRDALKLPLPDRSPLGYNCKAHFYVDRFGERADRVGLEQGLYDALQAARVISDDWQFRTGDGTRVIHNSRARVEFWITPIIVTHEAAV